MTMLDKAAARFAIEVADRAEIARFAAGGRDVFAREDLEDQLGEGPLILDGLRRRPHYFDGRFLTGADLTRDQDYVRQRQADMARAGGAGVISGLQVRGFGLARGQTIRIEPGLGLTPAGDVVMVTRRRDVPLLDVPLSRQLDAAMGLAEEPRVPLGRRTGLFILALRPVEFTANPIAAYPRTITGRRTVEDGDVIEATAITLIPFPDHSGSANLAVARSAVARQIFAGEPQGMPQEALPLAMLAIEGGAVRWLDMAMVRRETGADSGLQAALGNRPRALAEAHVLQHRAHLSDVIDEVRQRAPSASFAASQHFSLLPPAGQMPSASVILDDFGFSQVYFPPTVDVDLAFVPRDELGALIEESLALQPIDLAASAADLDATGVSILVPVSRERFQRFDNALPATSTPVTASAVNAAAKPAFDLLASLVAKRRPAGSSVAANAQAQAEAERLKVQAWHAAWQEAIAALPTENGQPPLLWYTRRRAVPYRSEVAGLAVMVSGDDVIIGEAVNANIERLKLERRLAALNAKATPQATARIVALLAAPALARSDILTASVVADLERVAAGEADPVDAVTGRETVPPPVLTRPVDLGGVLTPRPGGGEAVVRPGGNPITVNPAVLGRLQPASLDLSLARAAINRSAIAAASGASTAARADTELSLSEGEVLDVAQDYAIPALGEGLELLDQVLGADWPDSKGALWLGDSGRALAIDAAVRALPGERLEDFAQLLAKAVEGQDLAAIDKTIKQMGE